MKDEFVSTEHLLLALTSVETQGPQILLQVNGVRQSDLLTALQTIRGSSSRHRPEPGGQVPGAAALWHRPGRSRQRRASWIR